MKTLLLSLFMFLAAGTLSAQEKTTSEMLQGKVWVAEPPPEVYDRIIEMVFTARKQKFIGIFYGKRGGTTKYLYYLSDKKDSTFDIRKVGHTKTGKYIIPKAKGKGYSIEDVYEIAKLTDSELDITTESTGPIAVFKAKNSASALNSVPIKKTGQEVTVRDHVYLVSNWDSKSGKQVWMERATDSLRYIKPNFRVTSSMEVMSDREKIKELIQEQFLPFIKESGINLEEEGIGSVSIFDLNGNLREFAVDFPEKLNIPMTVVDDLFNAVLSSGIKCTFKKDHPGLKNAGFVYTWTFSYLEELLKE